MQKSADFLSSNKIGRFYRLSFVCYRLDTAANDSRKLSNFLAADRHRPVLDTYAAYP